MTSRERVQFSIAALICAATRLLAVARTPWDWDEILFCLALRDYDVSLHHPHPPGFPLFVAMGHAARLFADTEFAALQGVTVLAAMLLFPAVFLFAREAGARFTTSLVAGVLCAFFPSVWFFGGTAFSDLPSLTMVTFACALLLRGRGSRGAWLGGALLLALAVAIRPQNLLIGLVPTFLATRRRTIREVAAGLVIIAVVVGASFGGAVAATGSLDAYRQTLRAHGQYILKADSFLSPDRPSLLALAERFFLKPYGPTAVSILLSLFVVAGLVGRGAAVRMALATFGPFTLFAWLMLDRFSAPRFAIGYAPMLAIVAASGVALIAERLARLFSTSADQRRDWFELAIGASVAAIAAAALLPALASVRNTLSPPAAAIGRLSDAAQGELFVGHSMTAFMDYYRPDLRYTRVIDRRALPVRWNGQPWLLADVTRRQGAYGPLWAVARRQYFEVSLAPMTSLPIFQSGWTSDRTMSSHSVMRLPGGAGEHLLRLDLHPAHPGQSTLTVILNGVPLGRAALNERFRNLDYRTNSASENILELRIEPPTPVRLAALSWGAR